MVGASSFGSVKSPPMSLAAERIAKPHDFLLADLTQPLAPMQDLTVLRGAGRECGRRVEAGRLRPAAGQARHPTRWRLARSAGEGHQSPDRAPGRCRRLECRETESGRADGLEPCTQTVAGDL